MRIRRLDNGRLDGANLRGIARESCRFLKLTQDSATMVRARDEKSMVMRRETRPETFPLSELLDAQASLATIELLKNCQIGDMFDIAKAELSESFRSKNLSNTAIPIPPDEMGTDLSAREQIIKDLVRQATKKDPQ